MHKILTVTGTIVTVGMQSHVTILPCPTPLVSAEVCLYHFTRVTKGSICP